MSDQVAITIGNFDGVHVGHRALLCRAREVAGTRGSVIVFTFDPHPLSLLRPHLAPTPMSTIEQRIRLLRAADADAVETLVPSRKLLTLSPATFLDRLVDTCHPTHIVEGPDFRFGRDRSGDITYLQEAGRMKGFETVVIDPVEVELTNQSVVRASSTLLRWLVVRGRIGDAAQVLGRPLEVESIVVEGHKRGREIGFPTANLADTACLLPGDGVYAGCAALPDGTERIAAISVGSNPTFNDGRRVCEAHLIDYDGPLDHYGWTIRLTFRQWLRDQIAYTNIKLLIEQLHRDIHRTRELLASKEICG